MYSFTKLFQPRKLESNDKNVINRELQNTLNNIKILHDNQRN